MTPERPIWKGGEDHVFTTRIDGNVGRIKVEGSFTFKDFNAFKASTAGMLEGHGTSEIDLDLSAATYMDSNALSMLIGLREKAQARNITIKLMRPSGSVRTILEMVQFEKLFPILD